MGTFAFGIVCSGGPPCMVVDMAYTNAASPAMKQEEGKGMVSHSSVAVYFKKRGRRSYWELL